MLIVVPAKVVYAIVAFIAVVELPVSPVVLVLVVVCGAVRFTVVVLW